MRSSSSLPDPAPRPMEEAARRLGLVREWDFLLHLPARYVDETRVREIASVRVGETAQVEGEIGHVEVLVRRRRQLLAWLRDPSGEMPLRWIHFHDSLRRTLAPGARVRVLGVARAGVAGCEMVHPRVRALGTGRADEPLPGRLTAVYPAGEGLSQAWIRRRVARALQGLAMRGLRDEVPAREREGAGLPDLAAALDCLHRPEPTEDLAAIEGGTHPGWGRVLLDELLAQQLALREARARAAARPAPPLCGAPRRTEAMKSLLPFTLTQAQERAWAEIERDLARPVAMNRLLQGDVGSGKTVVAALAVARTIDSGLQAAVMAPTEILAEQHHARMAQWLEPLGVGIVRLSGSQREAERREALDRLAAGTAQLAIGTHALIQEGVRFAGLGLAVIDEQHRFGVGQRAALVRSGAGPHLLMLSATPIPRSLALSYLADLDVSWIEELPPGRTPVRTKLISGARRDEVLARVRDEAARGRQAYWVCPLVEESEADEATAAVDMVARVHAQLPDLRLGLLHGQMPPGERAESMRAFRAGQIQVLVATTAIEVGVDVPNASLMVVEHAQRFGLSTLHQLRGRIGRGGLESTCVLLFDEPLSEAARERLKVLYETTDGFEIARRDLAMRGPGEILGSRQWGVPALRYADLERDAPLLELARTLADRLVAAGDPSWRDIVERWHGPRTLVHGALA